MWQHAAAPPCERVCARRATHAAAAAARRCCSAAAHAASAPGGSAAPAAAAATLRRRDALSGVALTLALSALGAPTARADVAAAEAQALTQTFEEAFAAAAAGDLAAADAAWTRALDAAPRNAAAWSNRGTARLQAGRWADAAADLSRAVALDAEAGAPPDALALNNLGNALGATGDWDGALRAFADAARADTRVAAIARANTALALFQTGLEADALRVVRALLRRDPEFWDMRALAAATLWARGDEAAAEAEWATLCASGRGFGGPTSAERPGEPSSGVAYSARLLQQQFAQVSAVATGRVRDNGDNTPCALYASTARVAARWPPRATAALDAFLRLRRDGDARDYDGAQRTFRFGDAAPPPATP
jgi:tetratricopeptide (TPR) repeat protein